MLGEHALGYVGGAGSCSGCGEATAIRMLVAATRQVHGPDSMGIVAATGCNTVFGSTYPYNPYLVPWTNSLFENAPADRARASGPRWDQAGHPDRRLWVIGGDGAMYDIGFQALSRMVASGADIKVLVLDTQVYSNTGGQASTASFGGQVTKLSRLRDGAPRPARAPQGARPHPHGPRRGVRRADDAGAPQPLLPRDHGGERVSRVRRSSSPTRRCHAGARHRRRRRRRGRRSSPSTRAPSRCSPTTRGAAATIAERLSLQGNPALRDDWATDARRRRRSTSSTFARTEGRFAPHFAADGAPTPEIVATQRGPARQLAHAPGARRDPGAGLTVSPIPGRLA